MEEILNIKVDGSTIAETKEAPKEPEKSVSIVDEAKSIRDEILKAKDELKAENDRKDKAKSEELLGSNTGGHVEPVVKEETNEEYVERVRKAGWKDDSK